MAADSADACELAKDREEPQFSKYDPERLLTMKEFAAWAQVPEKTVRNWSVNGTGPRRIRVGRYVRFKWSDCLEWAEKNYVE